MTWYRFSSLRAWKTQSHFLKTIHCCETAGFGWVYELNLLNKSLSMNVFQMRGMTFMHANVKPDIDRENDANKTYSQGWNCLDVIFKWGIHWPYMTMFTDLMSKVAYIYSITCWTFNVPCQSFKTRFLRGRDTLPDLFWSTSFRRIKFIDVIIYTASR
jgi:hypothetical protein